MKHVVGWLLVHILALVVCVAATGLVTLVFPIPNWHMVGLGIWLIACFAGLCIPDKVWDWWLSRGSK